KPARRSWCIAKTMHHQRRDQHQGRCSESLLPKVESDLTGAAFYQCHLKKIAVPVWEELPVVFANTRRNLFDMNKAKVAARDTPFVMYERRPFHDAMRPGVPERQADTNRRPPQLVRSWFG